MKAGQKDKDSIEFFYVFAMMMFGAPALEWDDEELFYRTGIAIELYKQGLVKRL